MKVIAAEEADTTRDIARPLIINNIDKAKCTNFVSNRKPDFDKEDKMQYIMNNLLNFITDQEGVIVLRMQ